MKINITLIKLKNNKYFCLLNFSDNNMANDNSSNEGTSSSRPLSIQAPTTNNIQRIDNQPRQPRNLQGLLRFTMDAAKDENTSLPTTIAPLDEEV